MRRRAALFATIALAGTSLAAAQRSPFRNAAVETRTAPEGPARAVGEVSSGRKGPHWIGWAAPVLPGRRQMCCWASLDQRVEGTGGGVCHLESERKESSYSHNEGDGQAEGGAEFFVMLRIEEGQPDRLRVFSTDCVVDVGGLPLVWLTGVVPSQSVSYLESLVSAWRLDRDHKHNHKGKRSGEPALSAIALHDHPSADAALERFVARERPIEVRRQAAFWLGNSRGSRGYEVLRRLAATEQDPELRKHVTFALSQSADPRALETLIGMARGDSSGEVRGQALFWLAQKAGRKAVAAIEDAIQNDPETEVKTKAVFALTQLPDNEGVPHLIRVARHNRNPAVRKKAFFWLGQSKDPRALDFIEEVLTR